MLRGSVHSGFNLHRSRGILPDESEVVERILRHLGLCETGVRVSPPRAPPEPGEWVIEPCHDDPFPHYDTEPVMAHAND